MFITTLNQLFVLMGFLLTGFILKKGKLLPDNTATVISRLLNFVLMPATIINTFMDKFTVNNFINKWHLMLYSSVILIGCIIVALILGIFFDRDKYVQRIYRYSFTVGNFAFLGIAFVEGLAPDILFDYLLFILPMNLYTFSLGVAWLIPTDNSGKKGFSLKCLLNPICISLVIGGVMGLTNVMSFIPSIFNFLTQVIQGTAKTMAPMAMILTGFVIGSRPIVSQLKNYKVYICAVIRLIIMPVVIMLILNAVNADDEILKVALCANAMPLGLNTVVIPSAYGRNPELGGSLALVSLLVSLVTIPILFGIFFPT
ncbi:MAG: AEC family transporter [Oscillospiraceae bacterium]|nr:AEC family transporter [Oscillospiraceae bacterium]